MRFLHISDTHLGYNQYGLQERGEDFLDAFNECVDIALENNVDFIIHTGDFFHTSRPSNKTILDAINALSRLKNTPMFAISGNHDRSSRVRDISPLSILENFGLKLVDGDGSVEFEGVLISGLKYIFRSNLRHISFKTILEKIAGRNNKNLPHILLLHQEFSPFFPNSHLNIYSDLPDGFDYIGIGHYHIRQEPFKVNNSTVVMPGSTEFTAYNQNESRYPKGVFIVDVDPDGFKPTFIQLKSLRPFIFEEIKDDDLGLFLESVKQRIEETLENSLKMPVLIVKGSVKKLNPKDILEALESSGIKDKLLHVRFNLQYVEEFESVEFEKLNLEESTLGQKLKQLIGDEELYHEVASLINVLKTFEDKKQIKEYLREQLG